MSLKMPSMTKPRKPPTESVRINRETARKARVLAAAEDKSMPDWLDELLAELVEQKFRRFVLSEAKQSSRAKEG